MSKRPLRTLAAALVAAMLVNLLPAGLPLLGARTAYADPGTYLHANPSTFSSYGGSTVLEWDYDFGHWTRLEIYGSGSLVFSARRWFGGGINRYTWSGKDNAGTPVDDGYYTVLCIPDDEYAEFYTQTTVRVYNLPPGAPTVNVTKDQSGNIESGCRPIPSTP